MGRTIDETVEREHREKLGMRRKKKLPIEKLDVIAVRPVSSYTTYFVL
jgi:hypothetical protein